jgi:hypothetical protein
MLERSTLMLCYKVTGAGVDLGLPSLLCIITLLL